MGRLILLILIFIAAVFFLDQLGYVKITDKTKKQAQQEMVRAKELGEKAVKTVIKKSLELKEEAELEKKNEANK